MHKIREGRFVLLIVILILICVIPTIILVGAHSVRPQETAELNKNVEQQEEQISAATTTVNAGQTYTVPKTGLYKIELHGGKSNGFGNVSGLKGSKITGYVRLDKGCQLFVSSVLGGGSIDAVKLFCGGGDSSYANLEGRAGNGISVSVGNHDLGFSSGAPGGLFGFRPGYNIGLCYKQERAYSMTGDLWTGGRLCSEVDPYSRDMPR